MKTKIKLPSKKICGGQRFGQILVNAIQKAGIKEDWVIIDYLFQRENPELEKLINNYLKQL